MSRDAGTLHSVYTMLYSALVWGVAIDWILWQTLPHRATLLGAAIIVGSGLYLLRHERGAAAAG